MLHWYKYLNLYKHKKCWLLGHWSSFEIPHRFSVCEPHKEAHLFAQFGFHVILLIVTGHHRLMTLWEGNEERMLLNRRQESQGLIPFLLQVFSVTLVGFLTLIYVFSAFKLFSWYSQYFLAQIFQHHGGKM